MGCGEMKVDNISVYDAVKIVEEYIHNNRDKLVANIHGPRNIIKFSVRKILHHYNIPYNYASQIARAVWQLHYLRKIRIIRKGGRRNWYIVELLED